MSLTTQRKVARTGFTKALNELEAEFNKDDAEAATVLSLFKRLQARRERLTVLDQQVIEKLQEDAATTEATYTLEYDTVNGYEDQFTDAEHRVREKANADRDDEESEAGSNRSQGGNRNKYRLPKLELKKYGGDPKEWLAFWSQFSSIHEDAEMSPQEKYQYLVQATLEKSKARTVVESFPPTAQNYPKVIDYLQKRFGKKDVLVEVYTRELLKLVLQRNKERGSIASLYDALETQLRALESLDVKSESTVAILYPLVESALPEELLRLWERKRTSIEDEDVDRLASLMSFLRLEVESETRVKIALDGFGREGRVPGFNREKRDMEVVPSANELFNGSKQKSSCIFCDKQNHQSQDCYKAQSMGHEEKLKVVREKRVCNICLRPGHFAKTCKMKSKCQVCGQQHLLIMCGELMKIRSTASGSGSSEANGSRTSTLANYCASGVLLQTVVVKMKGQTEERNIRALIDTGSQQSYVTHRAAQVLGLKKIGTTRMTHCLFGGQQTKETMHGIYDVLVGKLDGSFKAKLRVLDQPTLCGNVPHVPEGIWMEELKNAGVELTDTGPDVKDIHLLIGADIAGTLFTGRIQHTSVGATAMETKFGWTLMGKTSEVECSDGVANLVTSLHVSSINVQDLWRLDVIGITDPVETKSREGLMEAAQVHFKETVTINEEGRYEVGLPWIEGHLPVSRNVEVAKKRLQSAYKKLVEQKAVEQYQQVFDEWKKLGVIEEVEKPKEGEDVSYLPHRPVFKPNSLTTPCRPVFDASAKSGGSPSLNDCLEKGPNLIETLPDILLRFRKKRFGITSDIKKAFLMISIREEDRNFLRFLWYENGQEKEYRHCRVVFGVTASPFLLAATLNHHLDEVLEEDRLVAEELKKSLYVDNCAASFDELEEMKRFKERSTSLLDIAKLDLRSWEWTSTKSFLPLEPREAVIPLLGLLWNTETDELSLDLREMDFENEETSGDTSGVGLLSSSKRGLEVARSQGKTTKREILSAAHKLFDPMGMACPVTLVPKLLLQDLWKENVGWDEPVGEDVQKKFLSWRKDLDNLKYLWFPRWTQKTVGGEKSLHVFCDASKVAYAACGFLRVQHGNKVSVQLVMARSRVASTKKMTIPRLELLGCCIAARLAATIKMALEEPDIRTMYWTDSSNALYWIKKHENWATFVWNRVEEIRKLSAVESWRHVPGEFNPADLPSRGCSASHLLQLRWWEGPDWLKKPEEDWPCSKVECDLEEIMMERRKTVVSHLVQSSETPCYLKYFSNYRKVVRMVAWIMRWRNRCCNKPKGHLTTEEEKTAEIKLWKLVQEESYHQDEKVFKGLHARRDEDGLWRVQTKIVQREDDKDFLFPLVLPNNHPLTKMMVKAEHMKRSHCGHQVLLCVLRQQFWIPKSRKLVREVIHNCGVCRRHLAKCASAPEAPLPYNRVRDTAVFEVVGVDLAGPLYLRNKEKVWFVIYTCAVYRAIHLELVKTLSTEGFLQSLRRFISRRGRPSVIYSDNGTNFEGASNLLSGLNWKEITEKSGVMKITWVFNPPSAPWWGGFWERLVGLVKGLLRRVLGKASLEYEELNTVLCDVEDVVNSRPLTYITENVEDLRTLTPSLFLSDVKSHGIPDLDSVDAKSLNNRLQYRQRLREDLRRRFRDEYLGLLVHHQVPRKTRKMNVGEIVLVGDDNRKRIDWKLGRVLELAAGRDGVERVARVKLASGELTRPVQRLFPLEMKTDDPVVEEASTAEESEAVGELVMKTRSGRVVRKPERFGESVSFFSSWH